MRLFISFHTQRATYTHNNNTYNIIVIQYFIPPLFSLHAECLTDKLVIIVNTFHKDVSGHSIRNVTIFFDQIQK